MLVACLVFLALSLVVALGALAILAGIAATRNRRGRTPNLENRSQ